MSGKKVAMFLLVFVAVLLFGSGCWGAKGSVVILEKPGNAKFDISFEEWSAQSKCEMALTKGDEVRVEIACDNGEIDLTMRGKKGSEPYTGNDITEVAFTVTVAETDDYVFTLSGAKASGTITLSKVTK
jgi:hypothetical protein